MFWGKPILELLATFSAVETPASATAWVPLNVILFKSIKVSLSAKPCFIISNALPIPLSASANWEIASTTAALSLIFCFSNSLSFSAIAILSSSAAWSISAILVL